MSERGRRAAPRALRRLATLLATVALLPTAGLTQVLPAQASRTPPLRQLAVGDSGFRLDLRDQQGRPVTYPLTADRLEFDGSSPVVLVVWADRRGADGRRAWGEALRTRYPEALDRSHRPGLVVLPVAHLPDVPGPLRGLIRKRYFDDRPATALDWDKTVAKQLGYEPGVPNLAVLAPDGTLKARVSGEATEESLRALFRVLDPLLAPPTLGPGSAEEWLRRWPLAVWP